MDCWLDELQNWVERICEACAQDPEHDMIVAPSRHEEWVRYANIAAYIAACHVFLSEWTGERDHLVRAKEYMLGELPVAGFTAGAAYFAVRAIKDAGLLSDEEDEALRVRMTESVGWSFFDRLPGFRRFNHAITTANLCDGLARLWPNAPEAGKLRATAEEVWREWWTLGDNIEGAPNYEAFHQNHLLQWGDRRGERAETLNHPGTRFWLNRALDHLLPNGYLPAYGDSNNLEYWCDWLALFAYFAAWEGNGRARWNVRRLFEWFKTRDIMRNVGKTEDETGPLPLGRLGWWHVPKWAWYLAVTRDLMVKGGADVNPVPPSVRPVVTHRILPTHDMIRDESWSLVPPAPGAHIPDKTILRMSESIDGPCAVLSNSRQLWHDHIDAGSVTTFCHNGTVLLDDGGYMHKMPVDHNMFLALKTDEEWLGYSPDDWERHRAKVASFGSFDFQVRGLTGGRVAQSVAAECAVPSSMPIYQMRTLLLSRSGVLFLHDRVIPYNDDLQGSPLWHTETIHDSGPGWALIGISALRGVNGPWVLNGPERLLIVDPLSDEPWDEQDQDRYNLSPEAVAANPREKYWSMAQTTKTCLFRRRKLSAGETHHFFTVLVPESVAGTPDKAVEVLKPLEDDSIVLGAAGGTVVMNERTNLLSGVWGETDARLLWYDGTGISAHRVKRAVFPGISIESDTMWTDMDLTFDENSVRGQIAAEKPTNVKLVCAGGERTLRVFGIADVDEKL